jgi:hypothetical protein
MKGRRSLSHQMLAPQLILVGSSLVTLASIFTTLSPV